MEEQDGYVIHLDNLTIKEIYDLIDLEVIDEDYPQEYYNNEWWNEEAA